MQHPLSYGHHSDHLAVRLAARGRQDARKGTGWIPTLALGMHLLGAQVHTYVTSSICGRSISPNSPGEHASAEDWLCPFDIHYFAPGDASRSGVPDNSLDFYFSVAVFEHVSPTAIKAMLREAYRTLRPGGLAYHVIGMFDHYT